MLSFFGDPKFSISRIRRDPLSERPRSQCPLLNMPSMDPPFWSGSIEVNRDFSRDRTSPPPFQVFSCTPPTAGAQDHPRTKIFVPSLFPNTTPVLNGRYHDASFSVARSFQDPFGTIAALSLCPLSCSNSPSRIDDPGSANPPVSASNLFPPLLRMCSSKRELPGYGILSVSRLTPGLADEDSMCMEPLFLLFC